MTDMKSLMAAFIARGGRVTRCPPGYARECSFWGGKPEAQEPADKVRLRRQGDGRGAAPSPVDAGDLDGE